MSDEGERGPKTFGELRRLLEKLGDPWQPDPASPDDEPLPVYPTGGDGIYEVGDRLLPEGGVADRLKEHPPANPDLRAVWRSAGLLDEPETPPKRPSRNRPRVNKNTPAPDSGG